SPGEGGGKTEDGDASLRVIQEKTDATTSSFNVVDDKRLLSLVKKLQNHLVSMHANRAALGLIPEHIQITRAVVDDAVHSKTSAYDEMRGSCLAPIVRQS